MGMLNRFRSLLGGKRVDIESRFELLREAVSGTMSNFYMARDRQFDRVVGLKIADPEKLAAFESRFKGLKKPPEGEIAVQFHHPLIVETYEYGETTKGLKYIVMEYLDGPGLQMLVHNRDPLLEGQRTRIIKQMAEALAAVHKAGFIHRDVCPRNFIARPDMQSIKLIDFGLTVPATQDFMQPGNRTGTPLYMAPEVVRRRWTDQRLDIFALGVTAYHICTYELPWPLADTTGKAALAHDTVKPRDILEVRPRLNRKLARTVMRCIEADPNRRPQTIELVIRELREVRSDDEPRAGRH